MDAVSVHEAALTHLSFNAVTDSGTRINLCWGIVMDLNFWFNSLGRWNRNKTVAAQPQHGCAIAGKLTQKSPSI